MNRFAFPWARALPVAVYAVAMAWVESAVVFYLRTYLDRIIPFQANPLPRFSALGNAELVRELATLVMLGMVGCLAGTTWKGRVAYASFAFGIWDIFYYFFLKILTGWPDSLGDWDILFLVPLPWWGPVWAPVSIALLMILWGAAIISNERAETGGRAWLAGTGGAVLALYLFMFDALKTASQGTEALQRMLPTEFNAALFSVALCLMAVPVVASIWRKQSGDRASIDDGNAAEFSKVKVSS